MLWSLSGTLAPGFKPDPRTFTALHLSPLNNNKHGVGSCPGVKLQCQDYVELKLWENT